jgi:arylformamidase
VRIYDVTLPLQEGLQQWPGDPAMEREVLASLASGDGYDLSRLSLGSHSGTHVDAPAHMIPGGITVDQIPMGHLLGPARVAQLADAAVIQAADLAALDLPEGCRRLLLKTANSARSVLHCRAFQPDYVTLSVDAARWLVARGIALVGIDALSVDLPDEDAAHHVLLGAGVVIVEGVDLAEVPAGDYWLCCLPLPIAGGDGAPARVVLLANDSFSGRSRG